MTLIHHSTEDNCFSCHGCFDRVEIPRWVNDPFAFVLFRERVEHDHMKQGCHEAMQRLEAMAYRGGNKLRLA